MAKKAAKTAPVAAATQSAVQALIEKIPAPVRKQIDGLRGRFMDYADTFRSMTEKRADLVDPFFRLLGACQAEIPSLQFVQFVGIIDPTVPITQRDDKTDNGRTTPGYRSHPTYQAALYLQRLKQQMGRVDTAPRQRTWNATQRLARTLATVLQVLSETDTPKFWDAIATELDLPAAQMARLQKITGDMQPIVRVNLKRRVPLKIVHMAVPGDAGQQDQAEAA